MSWGSINKIDEGIEKLKHEYYLNACLLQYYMNASSKYKTKKEIQGILNNIINAQQ